tara:strand:- start:430 stop:1482 length:1053 start_codon:yes stop_codon:yes gene_type:complete
MTASVPDMRDAHDPANSAIVDGIEERRHVLDLDDFSAREILAILDDTQGMKEVLARDIKKVPTLRGRVVVTMFYESSTRTRISFEEAGKILSADVINISSSGSSVDKGESLLNTGLTLQSMGIDAVVIRHPHAGAPNLLARTLERVSVINAGDGLHAHPTQALLDLFTVREKLGRLDGLKIVIVGDVTHSRVARSNMLGFCKMGSQVVLCGPPTLIPEDLKVLGSQSADPNFLGRVQVSTDLDQSIRDADVVMALRIQSERQTAGFFPSIREYIRRWQVTSDRMGLANSHCLVMHPGPMNEGIEISTELSHGNQSSISTQVTNGVAVRMTLLYRLLANRKSSNQITGSGE